LAFAAPIRIGSTWQGSSATSFASTMLGDSLYSPSTGVQVYIATNGTGQNYCGASQHGSSTANNGGKQFATKSDDPALRDSAAQADGPILCTPTP
jgi:hypothetical protein